MFEKLSSFEPGFLGTVILGNELWRYIAFLSVLVISAAAARLIENIFTRRAKWVAEKTGNRFLSIVMENMRRPLEFVVIVLGISAGTAFFEMGDHARRTASNLIELLIAVSVTYAVLKTVDLAIDYLQPRVKDTSSRLDEQLLPIIRKSVKVFIASIAVIVIIQNLGYNVISLVTGLGIGGLALALAAQQTLSNLFGAIAIFTDKPFSVGDRVIVDKYDGPIEAIGLRSTRIRTLDGTLVTVPNSRMADTYINNISKRPWIKKVYTLGVTYDTGHEKMKKALESVREIYKNHPSTDNSWVYFQDFGGHSLEILIIHWCKHLVYEEYLKATEEINLEIMRRFKEIGVEIAFPTQTLHLRQDSAQTGGTEPDKTV